MTKHEKDYHTAKTRLVELVLRREALIAAWLKTPSGRAIKELEPEITKLHALTSTYEAYQQAKNLMVTVHKNSKAISKEASDRHHAAQIRQQQQDGA